MSGKRLRRKTELCWWARHVEKERRGNGRDRARRGREERQAVGLQNLKLTAVLTIRPVLTRGRMRVVLRRLVPLLVTARRSLSIVNGLRLRHRLGARTDQPAEKEHRQDDAGQLTMSAGGFHGDHAKAPSARASRTPVGSLSVTFGRNSTRRQCCGERHIARGVLHGSRSRDVDDTLSASRRCHHRKGLRATACLVRQAYASRAHLRPPQAAGTRRASVRGLFALGASRTATSRSRRSQDRRAVRVQMR